MQQRSNQGLHMFAPFDPPQAAAGVGDEHAALAWRVQQLPDQHVALEALDRDRLAVEALAPSKVPAQGVGSGRVRQQTHDRKIGRWRSPKQAGLHDADRRFRDHIYWGLNVLIAQLGGQKLGRHVRVIGCTIAEGRCRVGLEGSWPL